MKHLLNNLSEIEKNSIKEQYEGGMMVDTSRFKKLLEATLGNVKPLISEQVPTTTSTAPAPSNQTTGTGPKPTVSTNQEDSWERVIAFSDPETTKAMTNIQIDPHMIGLEGNDVKFTYKVAGKSGTGTGTFNCNSENEMHFDGKPLTGTMYISSQRVDILRSKCGRGQGYASTGGNTGQNYG